MKKVLIAGGTGLIGKEIIKQLNKKQFLIHILSRKKKEDYGNVKHFIWNLQQNEIDPLALQVDHIINLTGAGVADKRWTEKRKELLISSRVQAATLIEKTLQKHNIRPQTYISASAIGYYGDSQDQLMEETNDPVDQSFLSTCTVEWEKAATNLQPLVECFSVVRIGIVLANEGGAFPKMLLPFKGGLASYFGDGSMQYSWIHIQDIARIFIHLLSKKLPGIYNGVAPNPVTNKQLIRTIRNNKTGFSLLAPVPSFALRTAMGEMADVVLSSTLVSSAKIEKTGFEFQYDTIEQAVRTLLHDQLG